MNIPHLLPDFSSLEVLGVPNTLDCFYAVFQPREELAHCVEIWGLLPRFCKEQAWHYLLPHTRATLLLNWGRFERPYDIFSGTNPYEFLKATLVPFNWEHIPLPDPDTTPYTQCSSPSLVSTENSRMTTSSQEKQPKMPKVKTTAKPSTQALRNANQNRDNFQTWTA